MTTIRPVGKRLSVKRLEAEPTTASGLYIPEQAREKPKLGTILAISSELENPPYQVGDVILFGLYAGQEYAETLVLNADDVWAVVE